MNTATTSTSQWLWLFPAWLLEGDARVSNLTQTHSISILSFLDMFGMFVDVLEAVGVPCLDLKLPLQTTSPEKAECVNLFFSQWS